MKEIQETIQTYRFLIATLLCVTLIPLGFFISSKNYRQEIGNHRDAVRIYNDRSQGRVGYNFEGEGYHPPSMMGVFSSGMESVFPDKVVITRNDGIRTVKNADIDNPYSYLFGRIDLMFNVGFILSLLAFIFTFSSIAGEKETSTLKLVLSNAVPRWQILLAKVTGNYAVFLLPFILSLLVGLLILSLSAGVEVFTYQFLTVFVIITFVSLLFMFAMFNLGMLISTLTHRSLTSIVSLLFVWVVLVLVIPKVSPLVAGIVYPVKSAQVITMEKQLAKANLEKEADHERRVLFEKIMASHGADYSQLNWPPNDTQKRAYERYDTEVAALNDDYQKRTANAIEILERENANKRATQSTISMNLSRISPVSCYAFIVTELSGTGIMELENFQEQARRFQERIQKEVYDQFVTKIYGNTSGNTSMSTSSINNYDAAKAPVPNISDYSYISSGKAIKTVWMDCVLLALYSILFFAASFTNFLRYDVR